MKDQTENLENTENEEDNDESMDTEDELTVLKQRAKLMGITFSNNISLAGLRKKVNAAIENEPEEEEPEVEEPKPGVSNKPAMSARARIHETRNKIRKDANKLIRIRYSNMNPAKKTVPGEWFTIANEYIGTIRKFVPFDEAAENGYHVPYAIYQEMKARKFVSHKKKVTDKGVQYTESRWIREFNIEVLEPLTKEEIGRIARRQMSDRSDAEE